MNLLARNFGSTHKSALSAHQWLIIISPLSTRLWAKKDAKHIGYGFVSSLSFPDVACGAPVRFGIRLCVDTPLLFVFFAYCFFLHQTFDNFAVVLYNTKQHEKTRENATTRNTTIFIRFLTTPNNDRPITKKHVKHHNQNVKR